MLDGTLTLFLWFYLVGSIVVGFIAQARGRSAIGWFALSLLLSPLSTVAMMGLMPSLRTGPWERHCEHCDGMIDSQASECVHCQKEVTPLPGDAFQKRTRCPECAELILLEAKRCRYCAMVLKPPPEVPVLSEVIDETPADPPDPQAAQT
jgi:hypothetical protein